MASSSSSSRCSSYTSHVVTSDVSINQLIPNQIYKICPKDGDGGGLGSFGPPTCGDSSTPFCFYFVRPPQKYHTGSKSGTEKLLIELMGGGACWDYETCNEQSSYLSINVVLLDEFLGYSCSEIQQGNKDGGDQPINLLCGMSLGTTNLKSYNTIIVPYCTQDVHVGSNTISYDDGNSYIHHTGANNVMFVMNWIYKNFPSSTSSSISNSNLHHCVITGCSAGGTAVPIVYSLLDNHYNHFGIRNTQISTIIDSPVYLTPTYFLENALDNWKPDKLLKTIGIPYNRYKSSSGEDYPTLIWDHILRKSSSNKNRWGFVSHTSDPISLAYYEWMSGSNDNDGNGDRRLRKLDNDNNNDDSDEQWYNELTTSIDTIEKKHKNVESYWMNSEGHCSFGLYYALNEEGTNFESWVGDIVKEDTLLLSNKASMNRFLISTVIGCGLVYAIIFNQKKRRLSKQQQNNPDVVVDTTDDFSSTKKDGLLKVEESIGDSNNNNNKICLNRLRSWIESILTKLEPYPITVGYGVIVTCYFWFMVLGSSKVTHILNNPSIGPSATTLSSFGINNPSLIILNHQWYRLLSSNFLCSGFITLCMIIYNLYFRIRHFECHLLQDTTNNNDITERASFSMLFLILMVVIATVINVLYCLIPINQQGASCSSVALIMGLQSCHLFLYRTELSSRWAIPAGVFEFLFVSLTLPFNSWLMLLMAIVVGPVVMVIILRMHPCILKSSNSNGDTRVDEPNSMVSNENKSLHAVARKAALFCIGALLLVPILGRFVVPNDLYLQPFYTGCKLFYSSDISELELYPFGRNDDDDDNVDNEDGRRRRRWLGSRWLEDGDFEYDQACAQFCIPHIATPIVKRVTKSRGIPIHLGQCLDQGYQTNVVDKTFRFFSYNLDVELYSAEGYNDDGQP